MDTNAKKYKYSLFNKTVCVVICVVSALIACFLSGSIALTVANNNKNTSVYDNYIETKTAREHIVAGLQNAVYNAVNFNNDSHKNKLIAQKNVACNSVYNEILSQYRDYVSSDEDAALFSTSGVTYAVQGAGTSGFSYDFNQGDDIDKLYDSIAAAYDKYVDSDTSLYEESLCSNAQSLAQAQGIVYIIANPSTKFSDTYDDATVEKIKSSKKYIIIKNGVANVKGLSDETKKYIMQADYFKNKNYVLYASIDEDGANYLTTYRDFYYFAKGINDNIYLLGLIDVLMVVLSIAAAFYYYQITGRKRENGTVKLWFIDWIPFEIQIALTGGIIAGAIYLMFLVEYGFVLIALAFMAACLAIWIALFLFTTSFARYVHSDKKFYKHLLFFWIFYGIYFAAKQIVALFKKMARLFDFKPKAFKKNIVLAITLYTVINIVIASAIIILGSATDSPRFALLLGAVDAVINFAFIVAVAANAVKYFKSLDRIIDLSAQHKDIDLEVESLPQSLAILAESMKYTNSELENAIAKAVKDERLRAELITNVSHDLKTPLTSIITYVDLLQKCDINDERAKEYIAVLDEKGAKLKRLIDDLIEASKVTSGNVTVHLAPMNLSELCLQSTVDVQQDFENANLSLVVKQGDKPVNVIADGAKTFRVIENLLSNARKYSAKGSRVYVSVYQEGTNGVFEIKNISAKPLDITPEELTERFVRGDKSRNQDGNGLGLSIAKELCKVQNGKLDISIDGDLFKAKVIFNTADI